MEAAATAAGTASAAGTGSGEAAGAPVEAAGARDSAAPAEAAVACDGRDWVSTTATLYHSSDDSTGRAGLVMRMLGIADDALWVLTPAGTTARWARAAAATGTPVQTPDPARPPHTRKRPAASTPPAELFL